MKSSAVRLELLNLLILTNLKSFVCVIPYNWSIQRHHNICTFWVSNPSSFALLISGHLQGKDSQINLFAELLVSVNMVQRRPYWGFLGTIHFMVFPLLAGWVLEYFICTKHLKFCFSWYLSSKVTIKNFDMEEKCLVLFFINLVSL